MPCPTCSHTMQTFGSIGNFWCPRCGTIAHDHPGSDFAEAPKLVDRCQRLLDLLRENGEAGGIETLHVLGITESIKPPD